MKTVSQELFQYMCDTYRALHQCPEIGVELWQTTAIVKAQLDAMGIPYTEQYGQCSVVATIGHKEGVPTIGFRADMDALPITEAVDVPYKSQNEGAMHACGHDSHTAIMLTVAKVLKAKEAELPCNVKLFFQPSEECAFSGAKMMVDNGCLEGVEAVLATHCEAPLQPNTIGYCPGDCMAACIPMKLKFYGKSAHATIPQNGIDAIAMAVESYTRLKEMVKDEAGDRPYIWSVGQFTGGEVHNIICDEVTQQISFRFFDEPFALRVMAKAEEICREIAQRFGGRYELEWKISAVAVRNDEKLVEKLCGVVEKLDGIKLQYVPRRNSSEDFAWFLREVPGVLFRYGSGDITKGIVETAHNPKFRINEEGMKAALLAFVNFALEYK
ncbi:MAG: amidohydrolase [Oscillospiraceae bacterium]|nr:amidohydrolase [Oscillospiraceae bacterium]